MLPLFSDGVFLCFRLERVFVAGGSSETTDGTTASVSSDKGGLLATPFNLLFLSSRTLAWVAYAS